MDSRQGEVDAESIFAFFYYWRFLALLVGPQVLGKILGMFAGSDSLLNNGLIPPQVTEVWGTLPGLMINVVFASLFLGTTIPGIKKIWRLAGAQLSFGWTMGWGQYVLGILLAVLVLSPLFGLPPMTGALIEIAFEGGHGTAAGMGETFKDLGFEEAYDLSIGLATVGLISGVVAGIILIIGVSEEIRHK